MTKAGRLPGECYRAGQVKDHRRQDFRAEGAQLEKPKPGRSGGPLAQLHPSVTDEEQDLESRAVRGTLPASHTV